jgi:hypothetical protein
MNLHLRGKEGTVKSMYTFRDYIGYDVGLDYGPVVMMLVDELESLEPDDNVAAV